MELIESEIDYYDRTTCPYNSSHRLYQTEKFKYHLSKCKDYQEAQECPYNKFHIFVKSSDWAYHVPRCPEHPHRTVQSSMARCPHNPNHLVLDIANHICPNETEKWTPPPAPLQDPVLPLNPSRIVLSFREDMIMVTPSYVSEGLRAETIHIQYFSKSDPRMWPGILDIERQMTHKNYLVALLRPNGNSPSNMELYHQLFNVLSEKEHALGVGLRDCGFLDVAYIFAIHSETSGFGVALGAVQDKIGLFAVPYSLLMKHEKLTDLIKKKRKQVETLQNQLNEQEAEIDSLRTERKIKEEKHQNMLLNYNLLNQNTRQQAKELKKQIKERIEDMKTKHNDMKNELINKYNALKEEEMIIKTNREAEIKKKIKEYDNILSAKDRELSALKKKNQAIKNSYASIDAFLNETDVKVEDPEKYEEIYQLENELEALKRREECSLCFENVKNTVNLPCGHLTFCTNCLELESLPLNEKIPPTASITVCTYCNKPIKKIVPCVAY